MASREPGGSGGGEEIVLHRERLGRQWVGEAAVGEIFGLDCGAPDPQGRGPGDFEAVGEERRLDALGSSCLRGRRAPRRVRGVSGVGRIRSVVSRANCIGTKLGVVSISVARSAAGEPPNCAPGSQGPWQ